MVGRGEALHAEWQCTFERRFPPALMLAERRPTAPLCPLAHFGRECVWPCVCGVLANACACGAALIEVLTLFCLAPSRTTKQSVCVCGGGGMPLPGICYRRPRPSVCGIQASRLQTGAWSALRKPQPNCVHAGENRGLSSCTNGQCLHPEACHGAWRA